MKKIFILMLMVLSLAACENKTNNTVATQEKSSSQVVSNVGFKAKDGIKKEELYDYVYNIINDKKTKKLYHYPDILKSKDDFSSLNDYDSYIYSTLKNLDTKVIYDYYSNKKVLEDGVYIISKNEELLPKYIYHIKNGKVSKIEMLELSEDKRDIIGIVIIKEHGELKLANWVVDSKKSIEVVGYSVFLSKISEVMKAYFYLENDEIKEVVVLEGNKNLENNNLISGKDLKKIDKYFSKYNLDKSKIKAIIIPKGDLYDQRKYFLFENEDRFASIGNYSNKEEFMIYKDDVIARVSTLKYDGILEFSIFDEKNRYSIKALKKYSSLRNSTIVSKVNCGIKQAHYHLEMEYNPFLETEIAPIVFTICESQLGKELNFLNSNLGSMAEKLMNFDIKSIDFNNLISANNIIYEEMDDEGKTELEAKYDFDQKKNIFEIYEEMDGKTIKTLYLLNEQKTIIEEENLETGEITTKEEKGIIPNKFLVEKGGLKHLFNNK